MWPLHEQHAASPFQTEQDKAVCARSHCWTSCRGNGKQSEGEVVGSWRGWGDLSATRVCFFSPPPPPISTSFLQEGCHHPHPVLTQTLFVFLRLLNLPQAGKWPESPRHCVLVSSTLCTPQHPAPPLHLQLPEKPFVFGLAKSVYLYLHENPRFKAAALLPRFMQDNNSLCLWNWNKVKTVMMVTKYLL